MDQQSSGCMDGWLGSCVGVHVGIPRAAVCAMTWVKILAAFALVGAVAYGGWHLRSLKADAEIAELKMQHAQADTKRISDAADKLVAGAEKMTAAAINYASYRLALHGRLEAISGKIDTIDRPLVVGCKPDDNRVRILYEAVDATNSAISPAR